MFIKPVIKHRQLYFFISGKRLRFLFYPELTTHIKVPPTYFVYLFFLCLTTLTLFVCPAYPFFIIPARFFVKRKIKPEITVYTDNGGIETNLEIILYKVYKDSAFATAVTIKVIVIYLE